MPLPSPKSLQLCPNLFDSLDYSLLGSSVHGIFQARISEWVAISSSRGPSQPRDRTCICRQVLYHISYINITAYQSSGLEPVKQLEKAMSMRPTPVLLPGESHGWRSLVGYSPWRLEESDTTEQLHFHFSLSCVGEGNGNPLQCSCLENPRDGGPWWAAISGVAQSRTRLKPLSSCSSKQQLTGIYHFCYFPLVKFTDTESASHIKLIIHKKEQITG